MKYLLAISYAILAVIAATAWGCSEKRASDLGSVANSAACHGGYEGEC